MEDSTIVKYRDEISLTLLTSEGHTVKQTLKNPILQSETTIQIINQINSSLAGGLSGMWYADKTATGIYDPDELPEITKIIKAEYFAQTTQTTPIFEVTD